MVGTPDAAAAAKADAASSTAAAPAESTAGSSGVSAQDQERLAKLGVLLVNMGAASEEKVFGVSDSATMKAYRDHRMGDLLVINRREDDAAAHPFQWYKPWTWWSSGAQVSPIIRVSPSLPTPPTTTTTTITNTTAATGAATATQTDDADLPPPLAVEAKPKPKKKGLPTVDMRPLTDNEVAALTPAVCDDRDRMLKAEETIHKALQNIEDTRYRYLVPSRDLHCEAEVVAVVRCYAERHQANAAAKAQAKSDNAAATVSEGGSSSSSSAVVRADLLACGPAVQQLKKCAEAMAMSYSHDGELA